MRQLGDAALRPRRRWSACFRAQRPGKRRVRKAFHRGAVGVAEGEDDRGEALLQAGVGVLDGLLLAAKTGLGFEDDAEAVDIRDHIHALTALPPLGVGGHVLGGQQLRQFAVEDFFLCVGRHEGDSSHRR